MSGLYLLTNIPSPIGTAKLIKAITSCVYGIGSDEVTKDDPRLQIQKDVIAKAATLEKNVIVTERLMSPTMLKRTKLTSRGHSG